MTLRTLTFDPALYKLVPIKPTDEMVVAAREKIGIGSNVAHHTYLTMAAAVPDTLPGVIEHSGQPFMFYQGDENGLYGTPLYDHPAPMQLVERQELSVARFREDIVEAAREWAAYVEVDTAPRTLVDHMEAAIDAIIAKDRGQA